MSSHSARLKARVAAGQPVFGAWATIADMSVLEIMVGAGFDFLMLDCEHGGFDTRALIWALAAFNGSPTVPLARIATADAALIGQALDAGADGVVVPQVSDENVARGSVEAARYAPIGQRGFGPRRAAGFGRHLEQYLAAANDELLVFAQVESLAAAQRIDEILEVKGLDGVFPGPMDMAASAGYPGHPEHPAVADALRRVKDKCKSAGMALCGGCWSPDTLPAQVEAGLRYVVVAFDYRLLATSADGVLQGMRARLHEQTHR